VLMFQGTIMTDEDGVIIVAIFDVLVEGIVPVATRVDALLASSNMFRDEEDGNMLSRFLVLYHLHEQRILK